MSNANTFNRSGVEKYCRGELQKAIEDFNAAINLDPKHVKAHYNRGIVKLELSEAIKNNPGILFDGIQDLQTGLQLSFRQNLTSDEDVIKSGMKSV